MFCFGCLDFSFTFKDCINDTHKKNYMNQQFNTKINKKGILVAYDYWVDF